MAKIEDRLPIIGSRVSAKDYTSFVDALLRRLKVEYADTYNDFSSTSVAIMLVELFSFSASQLAWASDRNASDCFLETARTPEFVSKIARQLRYKMSRSSGASASIVVSFDVLEGSTTFKKGMKWSIGGVQFEVSSDTPVPVGSTSIILSLHEGETRSLTFRSNGNPSQVFNLVGASRVNGTYIPDGAVIVSVDGTIWSEVPFLDYTKSNQFEVNYDAEPSTVMFGDGFSGNIPASGSSIYFEYILGSGKLGNQSATAKIKPVDSLTVLGKTILMTALFVDSTVGATGGADPETITEARVRAPKFFASRDVAVTADDYVALVLSFSDPQYGTVKRASAHVVRNTGVDSVVDGILLKVVSDAFDGTQLIAQSNLSILSSSSSITTSNNTISASTLLIDSSGSNIDSSRLTIEDSAKSISSDSTLVASELSQISVDVGTVSGIRKQLDDLVSLGNTVADTDVLAAHNAIETLILQLESRISASTPLIDSIKSQAGTINGELTTIGNELSKQTAETSVIASSNSLIATSTADIGALVLSSDSAASLILSNETTNESNIRSEVTKLFSSDSKSNLVQIPILVEDSNGLYAAPSSGLMRRVRDSLLKVKDVTHQVQVVSGASSLVYVDMDIRFSVKVGYRPETVKASIDRSVTDMLSGRGYNEWLGEQDVYSVIKDSVDGIDKVNVDIVGPLDYLIRGDVVVSGSKIVTKGTVTITESA